MKNILALGTILLSCCLAAASQVGSTPNRNSSSTPPTFPQDQTGQTPSNPTMPSGPSAIPPDTSATGQMSHDHANNSEATTLRGCLSQSSDGSFILADNSGNSFQLRGDTSQLSNYVGKEVRVDGMAGSASGSSAGAMSAPSSPSSTSSATSSGTSAAASQFNVSNIHKVSDACSTGSGTTSK